MTFIDSSIPMYFVGADGQRKVEAQRQVEHAVAAGERLVKDAEVFQEILHRYAAIRRPDAIGPAFEALQALVDEVFDVTSADVRRALEIVGSVPGCSAQDAVHVATMERNGVGATLTFDRDFDLLRGAERREQRSGLTTPAA